MTTSPVPVGFSENVYTAMYADSVSVSVHVAEKSNNVAFLRSTSPASNSQTGSLNVTLTGKASRRSDPARTSISTVGPSS